MMEQIESKKGLHKSFEKELYQKNISNIFHRLAGSRLLSLALNVGGTCMILTVFICMLTFQLRGPSVGEDGRVYYEAARHALAGQMFYSITPMRPDVNPGGYFYAPWVLLLYLPFAHISPLIYTQITLFINFVCFLIFAAILAYLSGRLTIHRWLVCCFFVGIFPGAYYNMMSGQINPLLWVLAGLSIIYSSSPLAWIIAGGIKPFCIFPLLAGRYSWKSFILPLVVGGVGIMTTGFLFGWDKYFYWIYYVMPSLSQGNFHLGNISIPFYLVRLAVIYHMIEYHGGMLPHFVQLFLTLCSLGAPVGMWLLTRRLPDRWRMPLIVLASAICAPICWTSYLLCGAPIAVLAWKQFAYP